MRKAWIEDTRIRDIAVGNPSDLYTPDFAALYDTDVPDDAENGDWIVEGVLVKQAVVEPVAIEPVAPDPPQLSPVQFKLCFTSEERIALKALRLTDPVIIDIYEILDDPRLTFVDLSLASVQSLIDYLVTLDVITLERSADIKAGKII